jgi:hypothetical protein
MRQNHEQNYAVERGKKIRNYCTEVKNEYMSGMGVHNRPKQVFTEHQLENTMEILL